MPETSAIISETVERPLEYDISEQVAGNGKSFKVINSENYSISLFDAKGNEDPVKKTRLKYNAQVLMKKAGIRFGLVIKEMKEDGSLIAGQQARLNNHRCVISEWDGSTSHERMSIEKNLFNEIMALVSAAQE